MESNEQHESPTEERKPTPEEIAEFQRKIKLERRRNFWRMVTFSVIVFLLYSLYEQDQEADYYIGSYVGREASAYAVILEDLDLKEHAADLETLSTSQREPGTQELVSDLYKRTRELSDRLRLLRQLGTPILTPEERAELDRRQEHGMESHEQNPDHLLIGAGLQETLRRLEHRYQWGRWEDKALTREERELYRKAADLFRELDDRVNRLLLDVHVFHSTPNGYERIAMQIEEFAKKQAELVRAYDEKKYGPPQ